MADLVSSFISKGFPRSVWSLEYEAFKGSIEEASLDARLRRWSARKDLRETSAEGAFIEEFFRDTWGYAQSGQAGSEAGVFTLWPKFPMPGAGETGGVGAADLAVGCFRNDEKHPVPQVSCASSRTSSRTWTRRRKGRATTARLSGNASTIWASRTATCSRPIRSGRPGAL